MIDKIQDMRVDTLKSESKTSEMVERTTHLEKLLDMKKNEIANLERKYAKIEKDFAVAKKEWRERDSERMRKFFEAKLKDEDQQKVIVDHRKGVKAGQPATSTHRSGTGNFGQTGILEDGSRPKTAAEALKDEQIEKLQDECARLQDRCNNLEQQNALLDTFSEQNMKVMGTAEQ
jgi:hypothetical protein